MADHDDPEDFERYGRAIDLLGMPAAAGRMYDRAEYYRISVELQLSMAPCDDNNPA